jgi:hypothetical protein
MRALLVIATCTLGLGACSTVGSTMRMTKNGVGDAVTAPLKDFNLVRVKVPHALAVAAKDPYQKPERFDCAFLAHEIGQLDLALGPDLDVPRDADQTGLRTRGAQAASDAALDAVRDVTTGWIPFRSVVRRLTGAAQNQDEIEDAVHAGGIRRAYLKGLGRQQDCPHPASPLPSTLVAQEDASSAGEAPAAAAVAARTPADEQPQAPAPSGAPGD